MTAMHRPVYESRLRHLVAAILPHLEPGDRVLDVGCGGGTLGRAIMDDPACPRGVAVEGLERLKRGGEPIAVHEYSGGRFPFEDGAYGVVIVADVLHHEPDPDSLIRECVRVSSRLMIIKDHQIKGPLAQQRVSFMDWAANAPYGVPCLYRYNTPGEWARIPERFGVEAEAVRSGMRLYPPIVNFVFGNNLQFMGVYRVPEGTAVGARIDSPDAGLGATATEGGS